MNVLGKQKHRGFSTDKKLAFYYPCGKHYVCEKELSVGPTHKNCYQTCYGLKN